MTLDTFIKKYDGKQVEVAGSANAKFQCVDLANAYLREVLSLPIIEWTDAKDFPRKVDDNFRHFLNTPSGVPEKGDLVVWNENVGEGHGHIAIFLEGNTYNFKSFDQNWSVDYCKIEGHRYNNVEGWLHPKEELMPSDDGITLTKEKFEELVTKASYYDEFKREGWENAAKVKQLLSDFSASLEAEKGFAKEANLKAEEWRTSFNALLTFLASDPIFKCRIDEVEIRSKATEVGKKLDRLDDIEIDFSAKSEEWGSKQSELNAEIARLKALLSQKDVLENAKMEDLLREIVKRLIGILKLK